MQSRRLTSALALIVLAVLLIFPAFFVSYGFGIFLVLVPLFVAIALFLKPGPRG